jgi:hypothetical protein
VRTPYTNDPADALLVAQSCAALLLTSAVWSRPVRSLLRSAPLVAGLWLCALSPSAQTLLDQFASATLPQDAYLVLLAIGAFCGTVTLALARRWWLAGVAVVAEIALWQVSHWVTGSNGELAVLHLTWLGALVGLCRATASADDPVAEDLSTATPEVLRKDDLLVAGVAFVLAVLVCVVVLERGCDSDDEWAYTWQAALLAHGKAFLPAPPCGDALRNYWIFFHEGRAFAQYTPGWPCFMVPFALLRVPWLAGPCAHALLAVAVARISRRAMAASAEDRARTPRVPLRAAGIVGALTATTGATALLNGASRYSHILLAALFAWSLELTASMIYDKLERRQVLRRATLLGACTSWLLATRLGDGAMLGIGIFFFFCYGLAKGRIRLPSIAATSVGFAVVAALTLLILRLQMGVWFKTGYSLSASYYSWAEPKFSIPERDELKAGLPLAVAAYTFWPVSAGAGIAGLIDARGGARVLACALALSLLSLATFYTLSELGRYDDFGYGNRFYVPAVVPLGVGTALLVAPMLGQGRGVLNGPATLALFAMVSGALRIAPFVYPVAHADVRRYLTIEKAIAQSHIHNALVVARSSDVGVQSLDVTRNWPIPEPDVIIAGEESPKDVTCLREHFPDRAMYRAIGVGNVTLRPL